MESLYLDKRGSSTSQVIIKSLGPGETYRIKAVSVDRFGNRAETAQVVDVEVKPMDAIPDMPKNFTITFGQEAKAKWDEVLNADVDYYELRTDNNPGNDSTALLARVKGTTATLTLAKRADTVYLFAKSTLGKYSTPARYEYNLPQLDKPEVVAKSTINGINLYFSAKPAQAYAIRCHVVGDTRTDDLETTSTMLTYSNEPGVYTVRCAFVDVFGEGKLDEQMVTIKATIPKEMLDREALGLAEFDKRVNELSAEFNKISNEYSTKVQNLAEDVESRFTQLDNGIELKVKEGLNALNGKEIVNRLNIGTNGIRLDGKLFHVTAETLFDNNIITNKMLQANSISADKLKVDSLSALSAYIGGTLRGGKLIGTEIQNESGSFKVDAQGNIYGVNITGSRIDANSVYAEGQQLKPVYVKRLDVSSGDKIELPAGYSWDKTLIFLRWISGAMDNDYYAFSGQNMGQNEVDAIQRIAQERFKITLNMRAGWGMNGFGNDLVQDNVSGANEDIASKNGGRFISFNQGRPVYGVVQYSSVSGERPPVFSVSISQSNSSHYKGNPTTLFALGVTEKGYFYYGKISARQGGWGRAGITIMSFW